MSDPVIQSELTDIFDAASDEDDETFVDTQTAGMVAAEAAQAGQAAILKWLAPTEPFEARSQHTQLSLVPCKPVDVADLDNELESTTPDVGYVASMVLNSEFSRTNQVKIWDTLTTFHVSEAFWSARDAQPSADILTAAATLLDTQSDISSSISCADLAWVLAVFCDARGMNPTQSVYDLLRPLLLLKVDRVRLLHYLYRIAKFMFPHVFYGVSLEGQVETTARNTIRSLLQYHCPALAHALSRCHSTWFLDPADGGCVPRRWISAGFASPEPGVTSSQVLHLWEALLAYTSFCAPAQTDTVQPTHAIPLLMFTAVCASNEACLSGQLNALARASPPQDPASAGPSDEDQTETGQGEGVSSTGGGISSKDLVPEMLLQCVRASVGENGQQTADDPSSGQLRLRSTPHRTLLAHIEQHLSQTPHSFLLKAVYQLSAQQDPRRTHVVTPPQDGEGAGADEGDISWSVYSGFVDDDSQCVVVSAREAAQSIGVGGGNKATTASVHFRYVLVDCRPPAERRAAMIPNAFHLRVADLVEQRPPTATKMPPRTDTGVTSDTLPDESASVGEGAGSAVGSAVGSAAEQQSGDDTTSIAGGSVTAPPLAPRPDLAVPDANAPTVETSLHADLACAMTEEGMDLDAAIAHIQQLPSDMHVAVVGSAVHRVKLGYKPDRVEAALQSDEARVRIVVKALSGAGLPHVSIVGGGFPAVHDTLFEQFGSDVFIGYDIARLPVISHRVRSKTMSPTVQEAIAALRSGNVLRASPASSLSQTHSPVGGGLRSGGASEAGSYKSPLSETISATAGIGARVRPVTENAQAFFRSIRKRISARHTSEPSPGLPPTPPERQRLPASRPPGTTDASDKRSEAGSIDSPTQLQPVARRGSVVSHSSLGSGSVAASVSSSVANSVSQSGQSRGTVGRFARLLGTANRKAREYADRVHAKAVAASSSSGMSPAAAPASEASQDPDEVPKEGPSISSSMKNRFSSFKSSVTKSVRGSRIAQHVGRTASDEPKAATAGGQTQAGSRAAGQEFDFDCEPDAQVFPAKLLQHSVPVANQYLVVKGDRIMAVAARPGTRIGHLILDKPISTLQQLILNSKRKDHLKLVFNTDDTKPVYELGEVQEFIGAIKEARRSSRKLGST